jgi:hypothetical protein
MPSSATMGFGYGFSVGLGSGIGYRGKFLDYVRDGDPRWVPIPRRVQV